MGINISIIFPNTGCHGLEIIWANRALIEPGIDHLCHFPENHQDNLENPGLFLDHRLRKKEPRIRILAGFMVRNGATSMAEFISM